MKVRDGFARNFLLPRGLGMPVNATNKAMVEKEKKASEKEIEAVREKLREIQSVKI